MKKFFELGDRYAARSTWVDFALTKFCLCAMGILLGLRIPRKHRDAAEVLAAGVFLGTYIPLMGKMLRILSDMSGEEATIAEE